MTDFEFFINAPDDLTHVELAPYFDDARGDDEESRAGIEALVAAVNRTGKHPASPRSMRELNNE